MTNAYLFLQSAWGIANQYGSSRVRPKGVDVWDIDNGHTRFSLAPGFTGALTRWEQDGVNQLLSPFPDQKTFGWMSPWYGGVTPVVMKTGGWDIPGKLYQETLETTAIEQTDEQGIPWQGVRISAELAREQLVGLGVEFDYLTVGNSNVLKLICRVHNRTSARRRVAVGWLTYWQLDGTSVENTLRSQDIERKHTPWESWPEAGPLGIADQSTDRPHGDHDQPLPGRQTCRLGKSGRTSRLLEQR